MDPSVITALAALLGAAIGGLTSVTANLLTQRTQVRAQWLWQEVLRRQALYKKLVEEASKCYVHALQHGEPDIPSLLRVYAHLGRMRVMSSPKVVAASQVIERRIVDTYLAPDKTFLELREMVRSGSVDLFQEFSAAARTEFASLRASRF